MSQWNSFLLLLLQSWVVSPGITRLPYETNWFTLSVKMVRESDCSPGKKEKKTKKAHLRTFALVFVKSAKA